MTDEHTVQRAAEAMIERLQDSARPGGPGLSTGECAEIAKELTDLVRWKSEATEVLDAWEAVWEAAGRPGRLGQSKAEPVRLLVGSTPPDDARQAVIDAAIAVARDMRCVPVTIADAVLRANLRAAVDRLAAATTEGTEGTTT